MQVITAKIPSRYDIGDVVFYHPAINRLSVAEAKANAIVSQVSSVTLRDGKVSYELAVACNAECTEFFHDIPVASVDAAYVASEDDLEVIHAVSSEIGSSGEMSNGILALSYTIQEKLQRLAERRCPDDPEGELQRMEEHTQKAIEGMRGLDLAELRKAAQRFHCIKNDLVIP